ncbi:cbb3-type cytochrome oxidase assembly protein CcoS [Aquitalea sp. ASV15]|uniref:cbb3-type cytochrome oxidase assembly protein CcoS n=1 Tax=Aquitalea sp. ASV15 TaxID=2795104 RepID=UPI0018EB0B35|nr:cbb3-type cytochrome oxidase assembly protein CcoS [Aquitalea sp. ASV15]
MESLYLLIPLSIVLAFVIAVVFWWATRSGQFDDMEGPAHRILMDDDRPAQQKAEAGPAGTTEKPAASRVEQG